MMESSRTASPVIASELQGSASEPELSAGGTLTQDSVEKETTGSDRKSKKTKKKHRK